VNEKGRGGGHTKLLLELQDNRVHLGLAGGQAVLDFPGPDEFLGEHFTDSLVPLLRGILQGLLEFILLPGNSWSAEGGGVTKGVSETKKVLKSVRQVPLI